MFEFRCFNPNVYGCSVARFEKPYDEPAKRTAMVIDGVAMSVEVITSHSPSQVQGHCDHSIHARTPLPLGTDRQKVRMAILAKDSLALASSPLKRKAEAPAEGTPPIKTKRYSQ